MVIRRIREHVSAHNWFAVFIDLVIVIIGVFIGIQVSNWNAARLERNQEQHYRERLIADLRSNEADMRQRRFYYGQAQRHAAAALRALENPSATLGEQFLIDMYQATQVMPRTTKRHTYDEMISAGKGELLGGPAIRDRVSNYYLGMQQYEVTFGSIPPFREQLRRTMPYEVQRSIRSRCHEQLTTDADGVTLNILAKSCSLNLSPAVVDRSVDKLRAAPELTKDLTRYLIDLDVKLDVMSALERRAVDLRRRLEAQSG